MKILKKAGQPQPTKLQKRISGISTSELQMWTENLIAAVGKAVAGLGPKTPERMYEAEENAVALLAVVQELKKRFSDE